MSKRVAATQTDADLCNAIEPPVRGCHAGEGLHVAIPSDWQARILAGQHVPGCSYAATAVNDESQVTLLVSDRVLAALVNINALPVDLRVRAATLKAKTDVAPIAAQARQITAEKELDTNASASRL